MTEIQIIADIKNLLKELKLTNIWTNLFAGFCVANLQAQRKINVIAIFDISVTSTEGKSFNPCDVA